MKSFVNLDIFIIIIIGGIFGVICGEKKVYRIDIKPKVEKDCHLKVLDQCLNKAYYFTHRLNQTDLISTENDFNNMCRAVIKVINCMDTFFERCSYSDHKELYQLGKARFYQSWKMMCSDGPLRDNYVKHSNCINNSVKDSDEYKSVCVNHIQKAFDKSKKTHNMLDMINIGCCAFNKWEQCLNSLVHKKCGFDGKQVIESLIEKASGGIISKLCPKDFYNSESKICEDMLPIKD